MNFRLSNMEVFLLQVAVWLGLWLLNDYVATLLTLVLTAIVSAVLVVALAAEWIERSRVPRRYFVVMGISVAAPLVAALVYVGLMGGRLDFLPK